MMLYLSFPVAMFWVSNQAEYFEEYIVKRKVSNVDNFDHTHQFTQLVSVLLLITNVSFSVL